MAFWRAVAMCLGYFFIKKVAELRMLKIDKVYNNNVVQAYDEKGREMIVMGRGLGFQKKTGDSLNPDSIEKTFILQNNLLSTDIHEILRTVSPEELALVNHIIHRAEERLETSFELSLYLALGDHLHYTLERNRQGIPLQNPLSWEIRKFYPREYQLGLEALALIQETLNEKLDPSEASSIALHFVNAQKNSRLGQDSYAISKIVTQILEIVHLHFGRDMDENDISYHRFVTHVQYFAQRVVNGLVQGVNDAFLYDQVQVNYPQAFACTKKIQTYVRTAYEFEMSQDEQVYLTIHIQRLKENK